MKEHLTSTYLMLSPDDLMSWTISLWRKPSTEVLFTLAIVSPTNAREECSTENRSEWNILCAVLPTKNVNSFMIIYSPSCILKPVLTDFLLRNTKDDTYCRMSHFNTIKVNGEWPQVLRKSSEETFSVKTFSLVCYSQKAIVWSLEIELNGLLLWCFFKTWHHIHFHCTEKSSVIILLNTSFCVPLE